MVANPDFLTGNGQDISPNIQERENSEGQLYLRFYVPSGEEFALPDSMTPYVRGEWVLNKELNQILRLLDPTTILHSARWGA